MIPAEAVEAAAKVLDPKTMSSGGALAEKFKEATRAEARAALEAAAPHMLAGAWDRGMSFSAGLLNAEELTPSFRKDNPYRSRP